MSQVEGTACAKAQRQEETRLVCRLHGRMWLESSGTMCGEKGKKGGRGRGRARSLTMSSRSYGRC